MNIHAVPHALHIARIGPQAARHLVARAVTVGVDQVCPPLIGGDGCISTLVDIEFAVLHILTLVATVFVGATHRQGGVCCIAAPTHSDDLLCHGIHRAQQAKHGCGQYLDSHFYLFTLFFFKKGVSVRHGV